MTIIPQDRYESLLSFPADDFRARSLAVALRGRESGAGWFLSHSRARKWRVLYEADWEASPRYHHGARYFTFTRPSQRASTLSAALALSLQPVIA